MKITISPGAIKRMSQLYEGAHLAERLNNLVEMGPIERKLRSMSSWRRFSAEHIDDGTWLCLLGAAESLDVHRDFILTSDVDADVLSEAIEAAEALNL